MSNFNADAEQPTERTPLLRSVSFNPNWSSLPTLASTLAHVSSLDVNTIDNSDLLPSLIQSSPASRSITPVETAFALTVLLKLRQLRLHAGASVHDIYTSWSLSKSRANDIAVLNAKIEDIWSQFLVEHRAPSDIKAALWTSFYYDADKREQSRVLDFLYAPDTPDTLISHPVVVMTMLHAWNHGAPVDSTIPDSHWMQKYHAMCTPWRVHLVELASLLIYLALLANYLLYPPTKPHIYTTKLEDIGLRECALLIYALSFIARSWTLVSVTSVFVILAFASTLPFPPYEMDVAFNFLLFGLPLLIFQIHTPRSPSPLLLFEPDFVLPLSEFLGRGFSQTMIPTLGFCLPVLLFVFYLLSDSISDTFPLLLVDRVAFSSLALAPMSTRVTLFLLLIAIPIIGIFMYFILLSALPFAYNADPKQMTSWDRFSASIGQASRRNFFKIVIANSGSCIFPAPFNLFNVVMIKIPSLVGIIFGIRIPHLQNFDHVVWGLTVGPVMALLAFVPWTLQFIV